ncbi:hypothetical protein MCP1_1080001 [Candidatus Terasakiella magnetica]|nr:hypothetical protein MCP1_1080001 [Candidatus Terasakiella magnetica]
MIAERRAAGWTWQKILDDAGDALPDFTAATLRVYWARHAKGRAPAEILLDHIRQQWDEADAQWATLQARLAKAEAGAAEARADQTYLEQNFKVARAEDQQTIVELRDRVADLEGQLRAVDIMSLGIGQRRR